MQAREEILRFWKDRAKRNNERYERRPLDLGFDSSFWPIYAQCKRSQSFTPIIDERLRQIKSQMLTASGIRENSLLDMICVIEGPRRCHLEEQMQALEEQRPEEYRRSKAACLRAELRILADDQKHFREFSGNCRLETAVSSFRPISYFRHRPASGAAATGAYGSSRLRTGMAISAP